MFATTKALAFQRSAELVRLSRGREFPNIATTFSMTFVTIGTPSVASLLVPLQEGQFLSYYITYFLFYSQSLSFAKIGILRHDYPIALF